jgi:hypothetical protein
MTEQFPHTLTVTIQAAPTLNDSNEYVFPDPETKVIACRADPNDKGKSVTGNDGKMVLYDFDVSAKKMDFIIPSESSCTLELALGEIQNVTVKRQHNGQLNTILWI